MSATKLPRKGPARVSGQRSRWRPATPTRPGIPCPACRSTEVRIDHALLVSGEAHLRVYCGACGDWLYDVAPDAWLLEPSRRDVRDDNAAPCGDAWRWLGFVRGDDGVWHQIAAAATPAAIWAALGSTWFEGDRLVTAVRAEGRRKESEPCSQ